MRGFIVIFLLSFFLVSCDRDSSLTLHDSQGRLIHVNDLQGKWVFVNYWATWCHACMAEIPELNAFSRDYQPQGVVLLGENYDLLNGKALREAVQQAKIAYPVVQEDLGQYFKLSSIDVVPTTFVLNPSGQVVKVLLGPQTESKLAQVLAQLRH